MKKLLLGLLIFALSFSATSQQSEPKQQLTKQDYIQKSKGEKQAAWTLLGIGTTLAAAGAVVLSSEGLFNSGGAGAVVVIGAGIAMDLISIPFFISSAKNARKAATISLNNRKPFFPGQNDFIVNQQPTICLKIGI